MLVEHPTLQQSLSPHASLDARQVVNNDDFTSVEDVKRILDVLQKSPRKYVALDPDVPTTPHDHGRPFREYIHAHYCLDQTFLLGPAQYREELWRDCKSAPSVSLGSQTPR